MINILDAILKDTYTLTQLKHRVRILKSYLINQLFAQTKLELGAEDLTWLNELGAPFYKMFNKDNVYQIFSKLEDEISKLPLLNIYLSFVTEARANSEIGQYIRKSFGKILLFDTKYDPSLVAGCALSWNGIYKDYSLKAKIEEKKVQILESFKKFLR